MTPASSTHDRRALAAVTVAGAALVLFRLGAQSLWLDEAFTWEIVTQPWDAFVREIVAAEANQGLYYLLMRLVTSWAGSGASETVLRLPSALAAIGTLPLAYLAARRFFAWPTATLATAALALNGFFVHHAQEARGYALATLLCAASSLQFLRAAERPTAARWAAYAALVAASVYAHAFAVLVPLGHVVAAAWGVPRGIPWRRFAAALGGAALLAAPFLLFAATHAKGQLDWLDTPDVRDFARFGLELSGHGGWPLLGATLALCALGGLTAVAAVRDDGSPSPPDALPPDALPPDASPPDASPPDALRRDAARFACAGSVVPIVLLAAVSFVRPLMLSRLYVVLLPALALLLAAALDALRPRAVSLAATAVLFLALCAGLVHWYGTYTKEDWRGLTAALLEDARPGDAIVGYAWVVRSPLAYYAHRAGRELTALHYVDAASAPYPRQGRMPPPDAQRLLAETGTAERILYVQSHAGLGGVPSENARALQRALSRTHSPAGSRRFPGALVVTFVRRAGS